MRKSLFLISLLCLSLLSCHRQNAGTPSMDEELARLYKEISKHPKDADRYMDLSDYFVRKNLLDSALNNALKAIRLDSGNAGNYVKLSDLYFAMKEMDLCEDMLNKALRLDDKNEEGYLKLAEFHFLHRRYEEAEDLLKKVLEINSYNPKAHFIRAWVYREQGDTVSAIRSYMSAVEQNAQYFEAYEELAHLYHLRHNPLAIEQYKNALRLRPEDVQTLYNLAMFYQETNDDQNAISQYKKILEIDPVNKFAMHNMGWIYMTRMERYDEAISCFTKAIEQDTTFVEAVYNRGLAFECKGNYNSARQDFSYVLHLDETYEPAIESLNRLDRQGNR